MDKTVFSHMLENRIFINDVNYAAIKNLCYEAMDLGMRSVQVFPSAVKMCRQTIGNRSVIITALIAYPQGQYTAQMKVFELKDALQKGADAFDVAINTQELKSGNHAAVREEMRAVVLAAQGAPVLFLLQTEFLTDEEIKAATRLAKESGAYGVVTSTGNYNMLDAEKNDLPIKTTVHEIEVIKSVSGSDLLVQAQGNILDIRHARELIEAGADILGSRCASKLLNEF
ncbi:MAG: deoxyribose-phosphate aldolase [Oscillospiraceae bacterium]|nr:deoxyribose-phosphate aldolase [Oscillospiraceae bacterium]